jgi:hypothetical protein
MSGSGPKQQGSREYREMTVALIRDRKGTEAAEVAFSESARFYKLLRENPKFETILKHLREAKARQGAVRVLMDFPHGDVIEDVEAGR